MAANDNEAARSFKARLTRRNLIIAAAAALVIGLLVAAPRLWTAIRVSFWGYCLRSSEDLPHAGHPATFLADLGPPALPVLLDALKNGDVHVRVAVAGTLQVMDENTDQVLAALGAAARDDAEREVRVAAGWSLYRRGLVAESMPYVVQALKLEPYAYVYTLKMRLAASFRIREAVEAVIADCEAFKPYCMDRGFDHLAEIVGEDIENLPKLKEWKLGYWSGRKASTFGPHDRAAILAEFRAWWEHEKESYYLLQDVLDGKVAPYRGRVRPEYR